ncbi:MAG: lipoprotein [Pseudomonadota bacterium]|jgi:predicted small lipoprotein YifL
MTTHATKAALLTIAIVLALGGCGRRGSLDAPAGSAEQPAAAPTAEEILGDEVPIDARPVNNEMDNIAPRRRVDRYNY